MTKQWIRIAAAAVTVGAASMASAQDWSFKNVSLNHLNWTGATENNTGKTDFTFLELEGGMGGKWGEVYGFFDVENPTKSTNEANANNNRHTAYKVVGRYNVASVGSMPVQLFGQIYSFDNHASGAGAASHFNVTDVVAGLGTAYRSGDFWINPFLGVHHSSNNYNGGDWNGGMAGWVLGYSFKLGGQSFSVTNWHEIEFARKQKFLGGEKKSMGNQGALSLWWNIHPMFTAGVQYRYAKAKLGSDTMQSGTILTGKFNF